VLSGIALLGAHEQVAVVETRVRLVALQVADIDAYVARGEWRGRAGGYAIQETGAALVESIVGDYANVVGLPVARLGALLAGEGISLVRAGGNPVST
jgi:septum formation protein